MEQFEQSQPAQSPVDIKEVFHLLWSQAWLIVLAGLLVGGAAYVVSKRSTRIYETSTRLLVTSPSAISGVDPTGSITIQTLTETYSQMLLDRSVMQGVIEQLKLDTTPEELKKSISVDILPNTQLLTITVDDPNPSRAVDIANATAGVFTARIRDLHSQRYTAIRDGLAGQVSDMENQIATTSGQIAAIEQQTAVAATQAAQAAAHSTPAAPPPVVIPESATLLQLQERLTQYRTIYSNLVLSYEQVRLAEQQTSTNVEVSEPAALNPVPVRPKTAQNTVLAAVVGMLLAVGSVFTIEKLDDTIKNPEEIRRRFELPILGIIARHEAAKGTPVALAEPRSPTTEAFRSLRTNITYAAMDRPLRSILITSPSPRDGKTTVACSLAVVLSQNEKRVLLLDADLRSPQVHHKFGLQNQLGLSDLFVHPEDDFRSVINAIDPPKLAVITSGGLPPNPVELLTSHRMGKILDTLSRGFDLIVIDTPPLLSVTDAAALAPAIDGVILVAKPGRTKLDAFQQALEQLRAVGSRVLGVVLNDVNPSSRKYGYYYNRYYSKDSRHYDGGWLGLGRLRRGGRSKQEEKVVATQPDATAVLPDLEKRRRGDKSKKHNNAEPSGVAGHPDHQSHAAGQEDDGGT